MFHKELKSFLEEHYLLFSLKIIESRKQIILSFHKGSSINYVVSRGEGGGGQKLPILLIKKMTNRGKGVKNLGF